ncbi:MAG: DNA N-6-adenine-methyltransferase, partial [Poseidonia sp.]
MSEERTRAGKMTFPKGPSKDDHRTPIDILVQLTREMGVPTFDLDAAASGENRVCWVYYDQEKDGLKQPWMGKTWCNPPYRQIPQWVEKAHREASTNLDVELVWMLLPCRPSTRWFRYVMATAAEIRLIHGRLKFHGPHEVANSSAPFP